MNNSAPEPLSKAKAYLKHYESFDKNPLLLDSAERFLKECILDESFPFMVQLYYLKNQFKNIIELVEKYNLVNIHKYFINDDLALMYVRIADAYSHFKLYEKSYNNYLSSIQFSPENLEYLLKTSVVEIKLSKFEIAKNRLLRIIEMYPNYEKAHYNLGLIYFNVEKDYINAKKSFKKAIKLNPDYNLAKENLNLLDKLDEL